MARGASRRLEVTLPEEQATKLLRLAARMQAHPELLAGSLLARAVDDAADTANIVGLLDGIPGAWERVREGVADVRAGRTVPLVDA